jgi:hemerythrin-like domain-containing protein
MKRSAALAALSRDHHHALEAAARVRDEHARIRAAVDALPAGGVDGAHELGQLLHDHVRFEERHLFALLEARLSDDELARLGAAIEHAEATG